MHVFYTLNRDGFRKLKSEVAHMDDHPGYVRQSYRVTGDGRYLGSQRSHSRSAVQVIGVLRHITTTVGARSQRIYPREFIPADQQANSVSWATRIFTANVPNTRFITSDIIACLFINGLNRNI
jgi:hypothetical protein